MSLDILDLQVRMWFENILEHFLRTLLYTSNSGTTSTFVGFISFKKTRFKPNEIECYEYCISYELDILEILFVHIFLMECNKFRFGFILYVTFVGYHPEIISREYFVDHPLS